MTEQETAEMRRYGESTIEETKKDSGRKCPRCRGFMEFDPKEGKLRCLSCDYLEAVLARNEEETNAAEQDFIYAERIGNQDWGVVKKTVRCEKCGIEMIYDAADALEECLYCGSNQITEVQTELGLAPGGVCVFELDAKQAVERYSVELKDAWEKAKELISHRLQRHVRDKILAECHADEVKDLKMTTTYTRIQYKLLLLPVWVICFDVKGKLYRFIVNGQNGSVSGKSPVSAAKVALTVAGVLAVLGILWFILNM